MNGSKRILVAAAMTVALGAHAQTKQELVRKAIELQRPATEGVARSVARAPAGQLMQSVQQAVRRLPADRREAVGKELAGEVNRFYAEVEPLLRERALALAPATLGPMLEERFSEDELKQLVAWLESPVAQKYQEMGPALGAQLGNKLLAETRASILEPRLKSLQDSMNKRLAAAAPAASAASAPATK